MTLNGPRNPNFDPVVKTGWNQCHCKDDQILSPATIHELKLELVRPKYHENQDNASIDASLTSKSHNFWFDRWIFKFHTFSETRSQDFSRGSKINSIRDLLKVAALEEPSPRKAWRGYKRPQAPFKPKKKSLPGSCSLPGWILSFFSLSQTQKHKKYIKASWFFSLHQKQKVLFLYPIFFFLALHFGFVV